jgi:hypothetical protein
VQEVIFDNISYHSTTLGSKGLLVGKCEPKFRKERPETRNCVEMGQLAIPYFASSFNVYLSGRPMTCSISCHTDGRTLLKITKGTRTRRCGVSPPIHLSNIKSQFDHSSFLELEERVDPAAAQQFEAELAAPMINRCFIVTQNGHYGLALSTARGGDYY